MPSLFISLLQAAPACVVDGGLCGPTDTCCSPGLTCSSNGTCAAVRAGCWIVLGLFIISLGLYDPVSTLHVLAVLSQLLSLDFLLHAIVASKSFCSLSLCSLFFMNIDMLDLSVDAHRLCAAAAAAAAFATGK